MCIRDRRLATAAAATADASPPAVQASVRAESLPTTFSVYSPMSLCTDTLSTVSYTHLDVYKRQEQRTAEVATTMATIPMAAASISLFFFRILSPCYRYLMAHVK